MGQEIMRTSDKGWSVRARVAQTEDGKLYLGVLDREVDTIA